jgi:hypothetical protein
MHSTHSVGIDGVVMFRSYAGAAVGAFEGGLLQKSALLRVK